MKNKVCIALPRRLVLMFALALTVSLSRNPYGGSNVVEALATTKAVDIPIGAIYSMWSDYTDVFTAMKFALERQYNESKNDFKFHLKLANIDTVDAYKLTRIICRQFQSGIFALMGTVDPESFDTLHSYANAFEMPFVTPWFPESIYSSSPKDWKQQFAIQIRPEYHQGLIDIITYYGWRNIIYIYSDFDGFLRLQRIYKHIPKNVFSNGGPFQFRVDAVRQVSSAGDAIDFLLELERSDRNAIKHVVLDCPSYMAKEIVLLHVRNVYLGRRNFHYLMSGLVMDDAWIPDVAEYYAVNITGLRLVSPEKPKVKKILREWKRLDKKKYKAVGTDGVSASGALAYDAVHVLDVAFRKLLKDKPFQFRHDRQLGPTTTCNMTAEGKQQPWKHGAIIARALKNVKTEGLTGFISFNEEGRRTNYSFDVVEMSPENQMVKIGTWSDTNRLRIIDGRNNPFFKPLPPGGFKPSIPFITQDKTYVMTTILERPYLMIKHMSRNDVDSDYDRYDNSANAQYEGYCKDLADELSRETGASFEIRIVKDDRYGSPNSNAPGGWDGMIGELLRKEAEIAIAPLTITAEREQVVDFSKVFMSAGVSIMVKRPNGARFGGENPGFFSFASPLSKEVWTCVIGSLIGVSIVIFIVSRFSPTEWSIEDSYSLVGGSGATVRNKFSVSNSIWFVIASALGQSNADVTPRSPAGRVVGAAWWLFILVLVASYTANLTAYLTIERMSTSARTADELSRQTDIEYGAVDGGATFDFFDRSQLPTYQRMYEYMVSNSDEVMVNSTAEGVARVRNGRGGYAFLLDSPTNEYENQLAPCNTIKGGRNLNGGASGRGFGIATSKGSGLRDRINMAVLTLRESGRLAKLKEKWWRQNSQCGIIVGETDSPNISYQNELSLADLSGIFFVLVSGLIVGMVMAIVEFCHKSKVESKRGKVNFSDAMKTKAKLALQGGTDSSDVDDVRFYGDSSAL